MSCCPVTVGGSDPSGEETWDVFVSHPGELKDTVAASLMYRFKEQHPTLRVFVDDWSLQAGDPAERKMIRACGKAHVGQCVRGAVAQ
jgi:hypothetical protein